MCRRLLQMAMVLALLCARSKEAQDPSTLSSWNQICTEVIRASRDPVGEFSSDLLARGEKAANGLLAIEKPAGVSSEQWPSFVTGTLPPDVRQAGTSSVPL